MKEDDRLALFHTSYRGKLLDIDLVVGQIAQVAVHIVTADVEEVAIVRRLVAGAIGRDRVNTGAFSPACAIC